VNIRIYDISGRLVRTLKDAERETAGQHAVVWAGDDERGQRVASGTYVYRMNAGPFQEARRLTLVK
jgi:flagellar hook assembly protein FlgD